MELKKEPIAMLHMDLLSGKPEMMMEVKANGQTKLFLSMLAAVITQLCQDNGLKPWMFLWLIHKEMRSQKRAVRIVVDKGCIDRWRAHHD